MIPFFILFILVSFGSVSAVLCTPALPSIQAFFGISVGSSQAIITSYLAGYALGQLPYGPLANGIGRKKTLYIGISLASFGSLLCAISSSFHSFSLLIIARFIQALGACVGLKMSFTMVLDRYDSKAATQYISKFLAAFAIMPGIASAIGGALVQRFEWESCFYFLSFFGLCLLLLVTRLPETALSIDRKALNFKAIIHGYRLKLKNHRLLLSGALVGSGTAVIYVFAARAPFIGIQLIGMDPEFFGLLNCIPSLGMLIGAFSTSWMIRRFSEFPLLRLGIVFCLIPTCGMILSFLFLPLSFWSLFIPVSLIYIADAWVFTMGSSLGLMSAKNKSNASAVFNCLNIGTAWIALLISEWIYPETAIALPIAIALLFSVTFFLYFRLKSVV